MKNVLLNQQPKGLGKYISMPLIPRARGERQDWPAESLARRAERHRQTADPGAGGTRRSQAWCKRAALVPASGRKISSVPPGSSV